VAVADNKLQTRADALLSAFDLKVLGQNPTLFGEAVQPTYDVAQHYLFKHARFVQESAAAITARGDGVLTTVPAGEYWLVEAVSGTMVIVTGGVCPDGVGIRIGFRRTPAPTGVSTTWASNFRAVNAPAAAIDVIAAHTLPRAFLLGPGSGIFARLDTNLTTGCTAVIQVAYYRLPF
jgi:hypothetical protein